MDEVSLLKEKISSLTIGIVTDDFSLLHDLSSDFDERGCNFVPLSEGEKTGKELDCLIIQEGIEPPLFEVEDPPTVSIAKTPSMTVDRSIACSMGRMNPERLVIGVDPGARPGLAYLADGILVHTESAVKPRGVRSRIRVKLFAFEPKKRLIRIGSGDPLNRDMILKSIVTLGLPIEVVDERRTTRGTRHRDQNAAVRIARTLGERFTGEDYIQR